MSPREKGGVAGDIAMKSIVRVPLTEHGATTGTSAFLSSVLWRAHVALLFELSFVPRRIFKEVVSEVSFEEIFDATCSVD